VSLTSHIADRSSPVRAFFERELGDTRAFVQETNRALRNSNASPPLAGLGSTFLVGTAADVLLNAWLDPSVRPARFATAPSIDSLEMLDAAQDALMSAFAPHRDVALDWSGLVRHGLLLARFVTAYRSLAGQTFLQERLDGAPPSLDAYAERLWTQDDERDLTAMMPAIVDDLAFLRDCRTISVNPTFSLSRRLGGADADLTAEGTLWDYKGGRVDRIVGRREIWQLVGYLLADTEDHYSLTHLGIAALSWRTRVTWAADELLKRLADGTTRPLEDWRAAFDSVVPPEGQRRRART
jgi:hypothetical protein